MSCSKTALPPDVCVKNFRFRRTISFCRLCPLFSRNSRKQNQSIKKSYQVSSFLFFWHIKTRWTLGLQIPEGECVGDAEKRNRRQTVHGKTNLCSWMYTSIRWTVDQYSIWQKKNMFPFQYYYSAMASICFSNVDDVNSFRFPAMPRYLHVPSSSPTVCCADIIG